jgi:putative peptidoglycan lipid II flippase
MTDVKGSRSPHQRTNSVHYQIAKNASWVVIFVLAAKIIAAAKEMAVAARFGISDVVDAYQIASTLMLWLPGTLGAAMTVVLIPLLVELKDNPADRNQFLSEMQGALLFTGISMGVIVLLLLPFILPTMVQTLDPNTKLLVQEFCEGLVLPSVLLLIVSMHSARLLAVHRQWNTLLEGMPALAIFAFILAWPKDGLAAPLIWGTLCGYVMQAGGIYWLAQKEAGGRTGIRLSFYSPHWVASRRMIGLMLLGQFLMSFVLPIDTASAASLGKGAVAQLGYAERVLSLLLSLGAITISRAVLPVFSEMAAKEDWVNLLSASVKWGGLMAVIGFLVASLSWFIAPWGIRVLFERGAFTAHDTRLVTEVFRWGLTRLPFYFAGLVYFQLLASQRMFMVIALIALTCGAMKYFLNSFLILELGVSGINLATGIMYAWSALCLFLGGYYGIKWRSR